MSTSAADIKAKILEYLDSGACSFTRGGTYSPWMDCFIEAISQGIYFELKNLEDDDGPVATGHN